MWRYHLISSPWRAGATYGTLFGAVNGVLFGAVQPSLVEGLVAAVIGGTLLGIIEGVQARRPLAPLARLPAADRATVMHRVHRGQPTTDRRLAPAVVSYAEAVRRRHHEWMGRKGSVVVVRGLAVLQLLLALDNAIYGDRPVAVAYVILALALFLLPGWSARAVTRQERAELSARALLG